MDKVRVVIINGFGGSGKSQFCLDCIEYCKTLKSIEAREISTIDYIKRVARMTTSWDGSKSEKDRIFLHDLKVAYEKYNDYPNIDCLNKIIKISNLKSKNTYIVFVNIREAYNINKFKAMCKENGFKVQTMKVINPNVISNEAPDVIDEIDKINYDITIINDGTLEDLNNQAKQFVDTIRGNN